MNHTNLNFNLILVQKPGTNLWADVSTDNPAIDCGRLKYVPFKHDPSKRAASLPVYFDGHDPSKPESSTPPVVPGVRSDGTDPFPVITSQEYVEIARGMREVLKNESPKITHKQQMIEFGQPAPQFWDDMIAEHKVSPSLYASLSVFV